MRYYGSFNNWSSRKTYTLKRKLKCVEMVVLGGHTQSYVSKKTRIDDSNISRWVKKYRDQFECAVNNEPIDFHKVEFKEVDKFEKAQNIHEDYVLYAAIIVTALAIVFYILNPK